MAQEGETVGLIVEAGLTQDGEAIFGDPSFQLIAGLGLMAYLIGRFVLGRRDPNKPRKWWDLRRID